MWTSVALNLTLLGFFKYFNFFIDNAQTVLSTIGFQVNPWTLSIILPVGISFYTFQEMSYCIDIYRGDVKPARKFVDFALFISFFPQLVAGPIERARDLLPQVERPRAVRGENFAEGLYYVITGLFKKIVIADNMATVVNATFLTPVSSLTGPECLIGVYAFAFQIYGDFSGYSSIAKGVATWMGFRLMDNFKMPYFALTPSDFWQRWHISLSSFLRDYLYIPLGGNRGGSLQTYRNLMLTMLLGGLWHGAAWTFVAWGFFHGLILCIYRAFERSPEERKAQPLSIPTRGLMMLVMFHLVCIGWLLFRAESFSQAWQMAVLIVTDHRWSEFAISNGVLLLFYVLPLLAFEFWIYLRGNLLEPLRLYWVRRSIVYFYCALMLLFFSAELSHEFIYFQF